MSNNKFRFSDRISFVTEHGDNVFINDAPLVTEEAKHQEQDNKAAVEAAYNNGWAECQAVKDGEIQKLTQQFDQVKKQLPEQINHYFVQLEEQIKKEILNISFKISELLLEREIENRPNYERIIEKILEPIVQTSNVQIRLNPDVAAMVTSGQIAVKPGVQVFPDQGLAPGEAVVSGANGVIDGTFAGRMNSLREAFYKAFCSDSTDNNDDDDDETEEKV